MYAATDEEIDVLCAMLQAARHATIDGLFQVALWRYAQHLGVDVPPSAFHRLKERL